MNWNRVLPLLHRFIFIDVFRIYFDALFSLLSRYRYFKYFANVMHTLRYVFLKLSVFFQREKSFGLMFGNRRGDKGRYWFDCVGEEEWEGE